MAKVLWTVLHWMRRACKTLQTWSRAKGGDSWQRRLLGTVAWHEMRARADTRCDARRGAHLLDDGDDHHRWLPHAGNGPADQARQERWLRHRGLQRQQLGGRVAAATGCHPAQRELMREFFLDAPLNSALAVRSLTVAVSEARRKWDGLTCKKISSPVASRGRMEAVPPQRWCPQSALEKSTGCPDTST